MPSGNRIPLSICLYLASSSSTFFPFLYQTRTLQSQISPSKHWKRFNTTYRSFGTTWGYQGPARHLPSNDHIPFEVDELHEANEEAESHDKVAIRRDSTITAEERAVFARIFKEIARSAKKEGFPGDKANQELDDSFHYGKENGFQDIHEIFGQALEQEKLSRESNATDVLKESQKGSKTHLKGQDLKSPLPLHHSIGPIHLASLNSGDSTTSAVIEEESKEVAEMRRAHESATVEKMDAAQTDIELWRVLETEVFILVKSLKDKMRNKDDTVFPASVLLSKNYSHYCLTALRLLRRKFPTSQFALSLLPAIKKLGPVSYVLGASSSLYNELLLLNWTQYTDLDGMSELLEEMRKQGVEVDGDTIKILHAVARDRSKALSDNSELEADQVAKAWWRLRGVEESWNRLQQLLDECREEFQKRQKVTESQQILEFDECDADNADGAIADDQGGDEAELRPSASGFGIGVAATQGAAAPWRSDG